MIPCKFCVAWFSYLKVLLLLFFLIKCIQYDNKKLQKVIIRDFLREWGVRRPRAMRQWCEGSRPVVICQLHSLFILLEYFQKYLYLSTFKTTNFYFYSSICLFNTLYLLQVVFSSVMKLLLYYNFWVLFIPLFELHKFTRRVSHFSHFYFLPVSLSPLP